MTTTNTTLAAPLPLRVGGEGYVLADAAGILSAPVENARGELAFTIAMDSDADSLRTVAAAIVVAVNEAPTLRARCERLEAALATLDKCYHGIGYVDEHAAALAWAEARAAALAGEGK